MKKYYCPKCNGLLIEKNEFQDVHDDCAGYNGVSSEFICYLECSECKKTFDGITIIK